MTRLLIALAAAAASLSAPLAAHAPEPPAAAPAAASVTVPFNPPLDRPVRYRSTVTRDRRGEPVTVWMVYEFRFSRRQEGGFRMAVRVVDGGSPAMPASSREQMRNMLVGLQPPYVLLLDADGLIQSQEDGDAYWERML